MMRIETITKLIPALIAAKGHFTAAIKDKDNPHFRSGYVSLQGVIDATEDHLLDRGLMLTQTTEVVDNQVFLRTTLFHDSGEYIFSQYPLRPVKDDPQGYGSAMTYARRYCLMALLGIAPEDDDGNAASGIKEAKQITFKGAKPADIPLPAKSGDQVNAERVAAGLEPVVDTQEKTAAAAAYQALRKLDKDWAVAIKHECGTDYRKMKLECDAAIQKCKERGVTSEPQPQ